MGMLDGKVAFITGGSRGMGASHAKKFVAEGAKVVIADVLVEEGERTAKELGDNGYFVHLDVTDSDNWQEAIQDAEDKFGPINILVNNAGILYINPITETEEAAYDQLISINQKGAFLGMKHIFPSMKKAGSGSIVNISSVAGFIGQAGTIAYTASKFAVRGMTKVAAAEYAESNIRVNSVHPGYIKTDMMPGDQQEFVDMTPLNRGAEPEEVSELVLYLASDRSSYSTGSEFTVDGGMSPH